MQGSVSLLLATLGAASAGGAWAALVGMPPVSVEAALEYGLDPARLAFVPDPGTDWSTAVGALLDAVDLVVVRPVPGTTLPDGMVRRLSARARTKDAVLLPFLSGAARWPGADVTLTVTTTQWTGVGEAGHGRLRGRQVTVSAGGRGRHATPRSTQCWLPAPDGGIAVTETTAARVTPLAAVG